MNFLLSITPDDYGSEIIGTKGFLETLGFGFQMLLLGMLTVFAVLCIIWLALVLFKIVIHDLPAKKHKSEAAEETAGVSETVEYSSTDDAEIVAAIIAAISAAETESPDKKFRVVSFKRK